VYVVFIYPVVEAADFIYGSRYGWLPQLLSVKGFMLRPEAKLPLRWVSLSGSSSCAATALRWTVA